MPRHIVWACFGVDADSPEEAKHIVKQVIDTNSLDRMSLCEAYNVNEAVFISPELDKMLDEIEREE